MITEYVNGDRELLKKVNDKSYGLLEYAAFGYINGKEPREYEASEIENEKNRIEPHRKLIESRQFATEVDLKKALAELSTQATAWRYHVLSKGTVSTSMFCKGCNNSCLTLSPSKKCKNCDAVPSTVYSLTIAIERDEEKCIKALKERSSWKVLIGLLKAGARSSKDFKIYLKTAIDDPEKSIRHADVNYVVALAEKAADAIVEEFPDYPEDPSLIPTKKSRSLLGWFLGY